MYSMQAKFIKKICTFAKLSYIWVLAVILPKSAIKLIMKKILSTISVVFCVISAKSQLNFIQDFENIQTVLQQFGVVNLVKSDQYEICNVTSLAIPYRDW